jgi:hypothetical protein
VKKFRRWGEKNTTITNKELGELCNREGSKTKEQPIREENQDNIVYTTPDGYAILLVPRKKV